jgi:hypothetical protein
VPKLDRHLNPDRQLSGEAMKQRHIILITTALVCGGAFLVFHHYQQETIKKQLLHLASDRYGSRLEKKVETAMLVGSTKDLMLAMIEETDQRIVELKRQVEQDRARLSRYSVISGPMELVLEKHHSGSVEDRKFEILVLNTLYTRDFYAGNVIGDTTNLFEAQAKKARIAKLWNDPLPWRNWKIADSWSLESETQAAMVEWWSKEPEIRAIKDRALEIQAKATQLGISLTYLD